MPRIKRILDRPASEKLENVHKQLETFFGITREEYLTTRANNLVNIRFIGCYVAMEIEKIDIIFVANSFGRDRTSIYHMLKKIESWLSLKNQYAGEHEMLTTFIDFYKGYNKGETRVYMVDDEDDDEMTDDEFMLTAEATGNVYTLLGFQEAYNNREFVYMNYSIRIINS